MLELNKLYCMDCMEGMRDFPDDYFDLAIVDPPYGIGYEDGGQYFNKCKGKKWDSVPDEEYFIELFRISKNQIIWGANYFKLNPTRCVIAWTKTVELQNRTFSEWEMAWTSFNTPSKYIDMQPFQRNGTRIHPTQKPIRLYKWLLNNYANNNYKIIDTHVGSGSSIIAFIDFGCDWIGFEIDEDYHGAATERIERHKQQLKLF